jgi:transposase-like protein
MADKRKLYSPEFKEQALKLRRPLRKALQHLLRQTPEMKYQFMEQQRRHHRVEKIARVLEVSRSGYNAWRD